MTEMITKIYNQGTVLIVTTQLSNWTLCMSKSEEEGEELPSVINQIYSNRLDMLSGVCISVIGHPLDYTKVLW